MNEPHRRIPIAVAPAAGPAVAKRPAPASGPVDDGPDDDGRRSGLLSAYVAHTKVYPRSVDGRYARLRIAALIITQLVFYGLPWLQWNSR